MADAPLELYFGFVRAIGTDLQAIEGVFQEALLAAGLLPNVVKISGEIAKQDLVAPLTDVEFVDEYDRYDRLMTAGDLLRSCTVRRDTAAALAAAVIHNRRDNLLQTAAERGQRGIAFLIRSLMHPAEVWALRDVYGPTFFVVSAYADEGRRRSRLNSQVQDAAVRLRRPAMDLVDELMARDRGRAYPADSLLTRVLEPGEHRILNIDKTFHEGDFFVDANAGEQTTKASVIRFLSLVLGSPYDTPLREEMGMAHAYAARRRSASLSRQVGAAVCDGEGNVLVTGMNDVPRAGGGQYWPGDLSDGRDHVKGYDARPSPSPPSRAMSPPARSGCGARGSAHAAVAGRAPPR